MKKKIFLFNPDYSLLLGYVIAFVLLLTSYFLTLYSNKELIRQTKLVNHTHKVISSVESLLSLVKDGETGVRGYINTKDSVFLEPYFKSIPAVPEMLKVVRNETASDSIQQKNLRLLSMLIVERYDYLKKGIDIFNANNYSIPDLSLRKPYSGKLVMDSIRQVVVNMQDYENNLLKVRIDKVDSRYIGLNIIVLTSLILAFIFAAFGVITFIRENKARKLSDEKLAANQEDLKQRIVELDMANKKLQEIRREEKFVSTGRIARIIAHEVRNPLTNIDLAISQIKEELAKNNEDADFLFEVVTRNSSRINQLITELLNATRVTELSFNKTPVNTILEEALDLAHDRIELNNITVRKNFTTAHCDVSVDAPKVKIAFLNLIINAIEAMKETSNKQLSIVSRVEENKCVIEIIDTGAGMDSEALARLFEAYYTTKRKGNGLGLTNTQNIILNHNGSIDVESKPGEGSRFIIKFELV